MTEDLKLGGIWFRPEKPEEKKAGVLTFNPIAGLELELYGAFGHVVFGPHSFPLILGETNQGKVTLLESYRIKASEKQSKFRTQYLFLGRHFLDINELHFHTSHAEVAGLNAFLKEKTFDISDDQTVRKWEISYEAFDRLNLNISEHLQAEIFAEGIPRFEHNSRTKVRVTEKVWFKQVYGAAVNFKEILSDLQKFWEFLNLCLDRPSFPYQIILKSDTYEENVRLYYKNIFYQPQFGEFIHPILSFTDLKKDFTQLIQNWFESYKTYGHLIHLRLYYYSNKNRFTIDRFLDMARILESFHRLSRKNIRMDPEDYRKFLLKIKQLEIDQQFKRLLNDRLSFGNEPTFKTRLEDLFNELPQTVRDRIDGDKKLSKMVKDTRNYYTHYGDTLKAKVPPIDKLVTITDNLEGVISFLLLKEIGIPSTTLEQRFLSQEIFRNSSSTG